MNANAALARYGLVAQTFHWCVVLLLIGLFVSNSLRESAPENEDWRLFWLNLHMSLGFLLCMVTVARLGWGRLAPPPAPVAASPWMRFLAKTSHLLLNLATLLIPITGYLRVASKDEEANFFGLEVPSLTCDQPWLHAPIEQWLHGEPMELFLYTLIGLHVAAALWHQFVRRDDGLRRMLPW